MCYFESALTMKNEIKNQNEIFITLFQNVLQQSIFSGRVVLYSYPIFTIKTKLRHLDNKLYPGGIQMVHKVVLYCQNLDNDLNNDENRLLASRNTTFML